MSKMNPFLRIEEIYNEHYLYLKNFLVALTKDGEVADDIIQELFAKILVQPSIILEVTYMKSWLIKGAKNTLIDYYKKKKPDLLKDERFIETLLITHQSPEVHAIVNEQLTEVLGDLSVTDKAIILAKEYYGYDYQEISELLNIPVSTLRSRVFRMRKQLMSKRR